MGDTYLKNKETKSKRKKASEEQENRPKKETIIKPDPSNNITLSNQLKNKISSSNSRRHMRKASSAFRTPRNAKPMPTLADLEKMFQQSDEDIVVQHSTEAEQQPTPKCSAQTSSSSIPIVVIEPMPPLTKRKKSCKQANDLPPLNISSKKKRVTAENMSYKSTSVSEAFSPIPSTSQSTEAFNINENLSSTKKQKISETHTINNTIVIEDEPMANLFSGVKIKVHDLQVVGASKGFDPATLIKRQNSYDDDDDCIIVENTNNNATKKPNIIDLVLVSTIRECDGQLTEFVPYSPEFLRDKIDIDAIIAHNHSLVDKNKTKSNPLNRVVDVDVSTPTQSTNVPNGHITNEHQNELKASHEKITISLNVQSQPSPGPIQPGTSGTFSTSMSYENCLYMSSQNGAPSDTKFQYVGTSAFINPNDNNKEKPKNKKDSSKEVSSTNAGAGKHCSKSTRLLGECPICIENMTGKEVGTTTCGHIFCMQCIETAMKHTNKCPTCRQVLSRYGYHKIFI